MPRILPTAVLQQAARHRSPVSRQHLLACRPGAEERRHLRGAAKRTVDAAKCCVRALRNDPLVSLTYSMLPKHYRARVRYHRLPPEECETSTSDLLPVHPVEVSEVGHVRPTLAAKRPDKRPRAQAYTAEPEFGFASTDAVLGINAGPVNDMLDSVVVDFVTTTTVRSQGSWCNKKRGERPKQRKHYPQRGRAENSPGQRSPKSTALVPAMPIYGSVVYASAQNFSSGRLTASVERTCPTSYISTGWTGRRK